MALLVVDCPRCSAKRITMDVHVGYIVFQRYDWQDWYEAFCICRACHRTSIFLIGTKSISTNDAFSKIGSFEKFSGSLNDFFNIDRFISLRDNTIELPPEHIPTEIYNSFSEGATCMSLSCNNAAAAMFRLCVDLATRPLLPDHADESQPQPNSKQRRDLGLRLQWLFDNGKLPQSMQELAKCIREDANDGAHVGSLTRVDAEDLLDFTRSILERLFTEPKRLALAEERRISRRST